jgi:hypothetical protein
MSEGSIVPLLPPMRQSVVLTILSDLYEKKVGLQYLLQFQAGIEDIQELDYYSAKIAELERIADPTGVKEMFIRLKEKLLKESTNPEWTDYLNGVCDSTSHPKVVIGKDAATSVESRHNNEGKIA